MELPLTRPSTEPHRAVQADTMLAFPPAGLTHDQNADRAKQTQPAIHPGHDREGDGLGDEPRATTRPASIPWGKRLAIGDQ